MVCTIEMALIMLKIQISLNAILSEWVLCVNECLKNEEGSRFDALISLREEC